MDCIGEGIGVGSRCDGDVGGEGDIEVDDDEAGTCCSAVVDGIELR